MLGWRVTLLLLMVACLSSFAWALRSHFVYYRMSILMRLTAGVGMGVGGLQAMAIFLAVGPHPVRFTISSLIYGVSLVIFWWTTTVTRSQRLSVAFSADEPHHLLRNGPYEFVRHPFYASYGLFWMAGFIAAPRWYLLPGIMAMFFSYLRAARMEEVKFANSALSEAYEHYRSQTGMFLPRFRRTSIAKNTQPRVGHSQ
jgi:protein-S-isoprenylcysteine O-methyltransferase Ste14